MKLSDLIKDCPGIVPGIKPDIKPGIEPVEAFAASINDPDIIGITSDSRQVQPGFLFIAVNGVKADGHTYINQAFEDRKSVG